MRTSLMLIPLFLFAGGVLGSCSSEDDPASESQAQRPRASILAQMMQLDVPWQAVLAAQREGDFEQVREEALRMKVFVGDKLYRDLRDEVVWRRYVTALDEGIGKLRTIQDQATLDAAVRETELACNECHRRYQ